MAIIHILCLGVLFLITQIFCTTVDTNYHLTAIIYPTSDCDIDTMDPEKMKHGKDRMPSLDVQFDSLISGDQSGSIVRLVSCPAPSISNAKSEKGSGQNCIGPVSPRNAIIKL